MMQFKAVEFWTLSKGEPLAQILHCLYIYPQSVNLSKKRNLFIRVELRKDDSDIRKPPLEVVILCFILFYINSWEMYSVFDNILGLQELGIAQVILSFLLQLWKQSYLQDVSR